MSYTVKEVSERVNLSPHTVRYYTDQGLIPTLQRDEKGNRVFTDECIGWFETIHCLRKCGMSIADVKMYVDLGRQGSKTAPERLRIVEQYARIAQQQLIEAQQRVDFVHRKIMFYQELIESNDESRICPQ